MNNQHYSREEVARHSTTANLWIIIDAIVYDLSRFSLIHPGGQSVLLESHIAGKDATEVFYALHRHEILEKSQYTKLQIGVVDGERPTNFVAGLSSRSRVPYAEPSWLQPGFYSPYYTENHHKFQLAVRRFVQGVIYPDAQEKEESGKAPSMQVFEAMGRLNLIAMRLGPGRHLEGRTLMHGIVQPEQFDHFHELIITQEFARVHARGYSDGLGGGTLIALPLVLNYGQTALCNKILPDILSGKKFLCLAVTEAFAGSDVAGIKCRATRSAQGDGWIINGTKKWITNGTFADYFTVACRTSDGGLLVLLVPRGDGVSTKIIHTAYSTAAGTAYVTFDSVHVPDDNVLGPVNEGLQVILSNFNHERWALAAGCISAQRVIVEECLKWSTQRLVFGEPLSSQAVIRSKLSSMISRIESCQSWIENITYQMAHINYKQQATHLAGQIAFLKMYTSRAAQMTAADAIQIFGGRGLTRTGLGKFIEHYHRTLLIDAVGGGAEDILGDLGVRQALRKMPPNSRL